MPRYNRQLWLNQIQDITRVSGFNAGIITGYLDDEVRSYFTKTLELFEQQTDEKGTQDLIYVIISCFCFDLISFIQ